MDWRKSAQQKQDSIKASIPREWILENVPTAEEQRDVTGKYIRSFLTDREIEITEEDAVGIVERTSCGVWSAVEVTKAFCHRAALAHQLVRSPLSQQCHRTRKFTNDNSQGELSSRNLF